MRKKGIHTIIIILGIFVPVTFSFAQNQADTILLRPYGTSVYEPRTYTAAPNINNTKPLPYTPIKDTPTPVVPSNNLFGSKKEEVFKFKLEVGGLGKNCMAGVERATSWEIDPEVKIDNPVLLKQVLEEAVKHDYRLRKISIDTDTVDFYYLMPAELFGVIPTNYLFHVTGQLGTLEFRVENPKWLHYAHNYHDEITQYFSTRLATFFTPELVDSLSTATPYERYAKMVEGASFAMDQINIYPYANTFWICVFLPYLVLFLIIFGLIIGWIFYIISRRRKKKYINRVLGHDEGEVENSFKDSFRSFNTRDDDEPGSSSLEDYILRKNELPPTDTNASDSGRFE